MQLLPPNYVSVVPRSSASVATATAALRAPLLHSVKEEEEVEDEEEKNPFASTSSDDDDSDDDHKRPLQKACPGYQTCFVTKDLSTMRWMSALTTHLLRASSESTLYEINDLLLVLASIRKAWIEAKGQVRLFAYPEYPYPHPTRKPPAMERSPDLKTALYYWYRTLIQRLTSVILYRVGIPGFVPQQAVDAQANDRLFLVLAFEHMRLLLWLYDHMSFPRRLSLEPWMVLLATCTQLAALHTPEGKQLLPTGWLRGLHQCNLMLEQAKDGVCITDTLTRSLHAYYCHRVALVYEDEHLWSLAQVAHAKAAQAHPEAYQARLDEFSKAHHLPSCTVTTLPTSWETRFLYDKTVPHLPRDRKLMHLEFTPFRTTYLVDLVFSIAPS